ncbi:hypothetical protein THRCLA_05251 [Thraustotheca clavata]|uniref:ZZ-type domain-containing protein n=1 Tax=Thraustotheca clavata TaxID=74557 RepID=A0A1V9ZWI1_9STRA|nr:hypothetical protein THRCLA_05251 [Thraustotheca clavata]
MQRENTKLVQKMVLKDHDLNVANTELRQARERLRQVALDFEELRKSTLEKSNLSADSGHEKGWIAYSGTMQHDTSALYRELSKLAPPVRSQLLKLIDGNVDDQIDQIVMNLSSDNVDSLLSSLVPKLSRDGKIKVNVSTCIRSAIVTDARIVLTPTHIESHTEEAEEDNEERPTDALLHELYPPSSPRERISSQSKYANPYGAEHLFNMQETNDASLSICHSLRELHPTKPYFISRALHSPPTPPIYIKRGSSGSLTGHPPSPYQVAISNDDNGHQTRLHSLSSKAKKFMGLAPPSKNNSTCSRSTPTKFVHEKSTCDGCHRSPIVGIKWVCRSCAHLELCDKCYAYGVHGHDHDEELFDRVLNRMTKQCLRLEREHELLDLLRHDICKMNLKKYSFCLTWIIGLIEGKTSSGLNAKALEITKLHTETGNRFAVLLKTVIEERQDIQMQSEWLADEMEENQTVLRIWIVDKQAL